MNSVMLVTGHYLNSKRRAGFHWLADAYHRLGWDVTFVTVSLSWISWLRQDYRFQYPVLQEANRLTQVGERLGSFVYFTAWHPAHLRADLLNRMSGPLFKSYGQRSLHGLEPLIERSSLIIFESTPGLLLLDRFKAINGAARYVYRVSDDLRLLKNHPLVAETEAHVAGRFDLISVPSAHLYAKFVHLPRAALHHHGIRKDLFDAPHRNPYDGQQNAVFVGNAHFDQQFIRHASELFPDWKFHIIGPVPKPAERRNVIAYGELPFQATVPYLKHADIGLHTLQYIPGGESFTDSLKVIQYAYCKLPTVAPEFLRSDRTHMFYYRPGEPESIRNAIAAASGYDRGKVYRDNIFSWDELAAVLGGKHVETNTAV